MRSTFILISTIGLSACGGSGDGFGFAGVPFSSGASLSGLQGFSASETTVVPFGSGGYVYAYGDVNAADIPVSLNGGHDLNYVAAAGVIPGTATGTIPTSGTATYLGTYQAVVVTGTASADVSSWVQTNQSGNITITADFDSNTLSGTGDQITIDTATINGNTFAGTMTLNNAGGYTVGEIDQTASVGAFGGSGSNVIFSGGFGALGPGGTAG